MTRSEIIEYVKQEFKRQKNIANSIQKIVFGNLRPEFHLFYPADAGSPVQKHEAGGKEIPFSQLVQDFEPFRRWDTSIESFEREGIEGLIDEENPEMILMGGELMEMARVTSATMTWP
jgi:hypothetical protein